MNEKCFAIIIGSVLGDGYLTPKLNSKGESQLWLKYSDKSLPYLKWLNKKLKPIGVYSIKSKKGYNQHQFRTKPSSSLGSLRKIFYPKGKKIIPKNIEEILTSPLSIAIWYMDDGNLDYRKKYHCNASLLPIILLGKSARN